jgi:hypothetical protein
MRLISFYLSLILLININSRPQLAGFNKESKIQEGSFICRLDENIIYAWTQDEGEYVLYNLYSLNLETADKILIDSLVSPNCWTKVSDSLMVYTKSNKFYLWNSNTGMSVPLLQPQPFNEIVGLNYISKSGLLAVFDFDYEENLMRLTVIDNLGYTFSVKIEVNENELEGISPIIESVKEYLVFSIQDKLYVLNLQHGDLDVKLISDGCNGFALYEDKGVLFYKFVSELKNEGSIIYFEGWETNPADKSLEEKIIRCISMGPFTSLVNKRFIPLYIICGKPYILSDFKWQEASDAVIYKDDVLTVKYPQS